MSIQSKLESVFLVSPKPLSVKQLSDLIGVKKGEIEENLKKIQDKVNNKESGIRLISSVGKYQFAAAGENSKLIEDFTKEETTGELTRPSLETLTIIAYRGPISKAELEMVRGVNCSLILRNLMMRGLVEAKEDKKKMAAFYNVTLDFIKFLGINDISELPDYEKLNSDEGMQKMLDSDSDEMNSGNAAIQKSALSV